MTPVPLAGRIDQSLVQIGPVASEELIKMWKVNGRTDDRRRMLSGDNSSPDPKGQVSFLGQESLEREVNSL
jgi:hypothetical protein